MLRVLALTFAVLLALTSCGGDGSEVAVDPVASQSGSPTTSQADSPPRSEADRTLPACSDVWVDGRKLPGGYRGCVEGETVVKADRQICSLGIPLVTYDGRFYAMAGNVVNDVGRLAGNGQYRKALDNCTG